MTKLPPKPYPIGAAVSPASLACQPDLLAGTVITRATVLMSDGSPFKGSFDCDYGPAILVRTEDEMATIVLSRDLTPADDGQHTWTFTFSQSGVNAPPVAFPVSITAPPALSISLNPSSATLHDTAKAGDQLTEVTFSGGDGTVISMSSAVDENGNPAPVTFNP